MADPTKIRTGLQWARAAGFSGTALTTIVSIDAYDGFHMTATDYKAAWLKTKGGKDFSGYYETYSINGGPSGISQWVPQVARLAGVDVTSAVKASTIPEGNSPAQNAVNSVLGAFSVPVQRFTLGIFGGILVLLGLMMFIKQLFNVSITGIPGKVGKVLAA